MGTSAAPQFEQAAKNKLIINYASEPDALKAIGRGIADAINPKLRPDHIDRALAAVASGDALPADFPDDIVLTAGATDSRAAEPRLPGCVYAHKEDRDMISLRYASLAFCALLPGLAFAQTTVITGPAPWTVEDEPVVRGYVTREPPPLPSWSFTKPLLLAP